MSFWDILYTMFIGPLQLLFEVIYTVANRFIGHPGLAIIVLSLIMNILVLPLYKRADALQEEARDIENKLAAGVAHIKKTFSGDEQMMILQTYYRQNNYKPTDALNGSVSLLLEIPFFMAAYQFLSHLSIIQGVSLGPIADLGAPDGLIIIGGISINLLPVLMTSINVISSAIYLKGFPLKTKVQLYGMALFFLVFLYNSPAGLVFYWTLNNLFSLGKTLVYKIVKKKDSEHKAVEINHKEAKNNKQLFVAGGVFLAILVGVFIPSTLIAASPQEFVDVMYFHNPMWYIIHSLCISTGFFVIWLGVFYWLANEGGKVIFDRVVWILCGVMVINYLFFGTKLGIISATLQYDNGMSFDVWQKIINTLVVIIVSCLMYFIAVKWKSRPVGIIITAIIALCIMSGIKIHTINASVSEVKLIAEAYSKNQPGFSLSKSGKNVIVIMLDRAMGMYVPYMFNEKPELKEQFAGFTYYNNVVSYGGSTNFGVPPLFGGYEYTPVEMNKRDDMLLVDKHNEALKVMPVLFDEKGYDVTVCEPPYANYQWIPDLSIYEEYPEIATYLTDGQFVDGASKQKLIDSTRRNFFCFSLMKTMPVVFQEFMYNRGNYNQAENSKEPVYSIQTLHGNTTAEGISTDFMNSYNVLANLPVMTQVNEEGNNTFLMMSNDTTHWSMLLQLPEYEPAMVVDNTEYEAANAGRFTLDGITLKMEKEYQYTHYQANMASMLQLGKWFDYLRENDIYDNTRIILASDHGYYMDSIEELSLIKNDELACSAELFFPLLMVKDFDSEEFFVSDEFMTNADVPSMAVKDVIANPVNPFTGKAITNDAKFADEQYVIMSGEWDIDTNNGNMFIPAKWWKISQSIWKRENWKLIDEEVVLP